ncbi:hypothetical protein H4W79_003220 [Nocardiopsis terrae]|uniref:Competence protein CoiA-like family protein n=1 Tax=Nocardiopsis terrae TaxID=372655 RepID=A0ABR9HJ11_9ACTN|nr:competence protein CoiA family protein [Nocardiopsis terrae]MBE1459006.1 hypothetical protein [Nocardiopsis terrae]
MPLDHRLVQTAVLGASRSHEPVYIPMERGAALEFRRRHEGRTFWCGVYLGGCGGRLAPRVYRDKVSHFAHHANGNACTRRHGGIESADHLYASRQVNQWLTGQGMATREPHFSGDFESGGTCDRLVLPATDGQPSLLFEFTTEVTEELERLYSHLRGGAPAWLVKQNPELVRRLTRDHGRALRFRMGTADLKRVLEVGVTAPDGQTRWFPFEACTLTSKGITVPKGRGSLARDTPKGDGRHPAVADLESALELDDEEGIRVAGRRLRSEIMSSSDPRITRKLSALQSLLSRATEKLRVRDGGVPRKAGQGSSPRRGKPEERPGPPGSGAVAGVHPTSMYRLPYKERVDALLYCVRTDPSKDRRREARQILRRMQKVATRSDWQKIQDALRKPNQKLAPRPGTKRKRG